MKKKRVVITGIGVVSPLGFSKEELWDSLIKRKISLEKESYFVEGKKQGIFWSYKIRNFDIERFGIDKKELNYIKSWKRGRSSRILDYLLAAVKVAFDDSRFVYDKQDNNIGSFITVEHPDFDSFCIELIDDTIKNIGQTNRYKNKGDLLEYLYKNNERNAYDLHTFMYLYFVNKVFGLHGYSLFVNNACASGLYALEAAARQIRVGYSQIAVIAAGDDGANFYKYRWFKDKGLYAEDGLIKPFSKDANGLVIGEGASAIVIEDYEHARRRGADIYGEYLGGGFSMEGWKVVYPNVAEDYYHKCINESLKVSNLSCNDIDLINPHGAGMKITDLYEARAISNIFSNSKKCLVTALKPYMGHNLGGSALIESIILLMMMNKNKILPTLNCKRPIKEIGSKLLTEETKKNINVAMKISCGFAGYNGAVVFKKI
jgi:3-oxoacyl-(acyl-carrier-protein) synthase